jgi:alginate O-acetyltransferase complex protein AlgJ
MSAASKQPFHQLLAALVFIAVMLAGAVQMVLAWPELRWQEVPHSVADFREGRTTLALEKQLDKKMPWREEVIGFANGLRYKLTGGAVDQVRLGQDGWLFLTEELRFEAQGLAHLQARVDLLAQASQHLRTQGVTLLVAVVPDKARVYAQYLQRGAYPQYQQGRYSELLNALGQRGVHTVDLLAPLEAARSTQQVYYRTDTHWSQPGAQLSAQAVAQALRRLNIPLEPSQFVTQQEPQTAPRVGDLIRLMGLEHMPQALRPSPDQEAPASTQAIASSVGGLLGDVQVPVVLVGTSYSLRGNFHGYLQQALSASVLNAAKDGGGFLQSATQYLRDDAFKQNKPKVIVWELPERFAYAALQEEKTWLQQLGWAP